MLVSTNSEIGMYLLPAERLGNALLTSPEPTNSTYRHLSDAYRHAGDCSKVGSLAVTGGSSAALRDANTG